MSDNNKSWRDVMDHVFDLRARDFLHTSFPAIITRVVNSNLVDVQPLVTTMRQDGSVQPYPELFDVRMQTYATNGECFVSVPTKVGQRVWVFVSERDVAKLMTTDGNTAQDSTTQRTHDLSDCFCIPSFFPDGNLKQFSQEDVVIRNTDTEIAIKPSEINVQASLSTFNGKVSITDEMASETSVEAPKYIVAGKNGASGTFTSQDGKTVTVLNGLVISII